MRQNKTDFITIHEFHTQQEWDTYQAKINTDMNNVEIIENTTQHTQSDCILL